MWEHVQTFAVGGLENIGFIPDTDFLLVVSSEGRGIFDCTKGEKIALDADSSSTVFDHESGDAAGFDIFQGQKIKTHGLFGGDRLPKNTGDGWRLRRDGRNGGNDSDFVLTSSKNSEKIVVGNDSVCELRAFGFSPTEKTFVFAISCDLTIFRRKDD